MKSLYKLPRPVLATLLIGIGIFFIISNDPPHHMCDTQIEHFNQKQSQLGDREKKMQYCRDTNSPGGCYDLFSYLNRTLKNFYLVSQECLPSLSNKTNIKKIMLEGMELMVQLAWREEVLSGKVDKFNWLGYADMTLFCDLKDRIIAFYGHSTFDNFEKTLLAKFSADKPVNPTLVRKKSILSEYCTNYR